MLSKERALENDQRDRKILAIGLVWAIWFLPAACSATNLVMAVLKKASFQPWAMITWLVSIINSIAVCKVWGRRVGGIFWLVVTFMSVVAFAVLVFRGSAHWPITLPAIVLSCATSAMMLLAEDEWLRGRKP